MKSSKFGMEECLSWRTFRGYFCNDLVCTKNNHNPFNYLDIVSLVAPIGIFFGRISNFINSELHGKVTDLPWAVNFIKVDNLYRHPSQLYEATF